MAFVAGNQTRLITGAFSLSAFTTQVAFSSSVATIDRTAMTSTAMEYIPGQESHTFSVSSMLDDSATAGGYWTTLSGNHAAGTLLPVTVAPAGFAAGNSAWLAEAYEVNLTPTSTAAGGVDMGIDYQVTGAAAIGQSLATHAAVTATGNGSAVDNGAASSNGGIAHLHVTALGGTGSPTCDVTIEHSVNGSTSWATLATFTQVTTAVASQRVVVASGTTVRRYLRVAYTVAGTNPTYTLAVAFARS